MRAYTWSGGKVSQGIAVTVDEKLGQVIFLGESGRGRRYEKVALGKRNPAEVVNGRVIETRPVKITLPAKDGKPEKVFYVLERLPGATENILVRINTQWCYTKNTTGRWEAITGSPETLVVGYGAHGDAGRIGSWTDSLIIMRAGDVIKIKPEGGHKTNFYAFWIDADGNPQTATWQDYENLLAVAKAEEMIEQAAASPEALDMVFGQMPAFTWSGDQVVKGIKVSKGATGAVISLGEEGRGRSLVEVPLVGITPVTQTPQYGQPTEIIETAAVVKLEEKTIPARYSWEQPTTKTIYGLAKSDKKEEAFLVRVSTGRGYTRRGNGSWELWKGSPVVLAKGSGADGAAGGIGSWIDGLFVLREGDVVYVRPSGDGPAYALFVESGKVQSEPWISWKVKDAKRDPNFYVAKDTAPYGHVPDEWIGRVVTIKVMGERGMSGGSMIPTYTEAETGELISVNPLVLNLGWDGRDRHDVTINFALWINLTDKQVRRLEGEALEKRQQIRAEADALRNKAIEATKQGFFQLITDTYLRDQVQGLAQGQSFDTMPTEGWDSMISWVEQAKRTLEKLDEATEGLKVLETQQNTGRILVNFDAWHRRGGMSGNGDGWVVRADGSLRDCDSDNIRRHKSDGTYHWNLVSDDELALKWSCGTMRDVAGSSTFEIAKAPVNGCTSAQLEAVARIEDEIGAPRNAFGLHAQIQEVFDNRMEAIRRACQKSKVLRSVPENLDYLSVSGEYGQGVNPDCINGGVEHFVDWNSEFSESCENRSAQIVDIQPAGDGKLEFLVYEKWGGTNLNIRWRELREGESAEDAEPEVVPEEERTAPTTDAMAALFAKFGRK